MHTRQLDGRVLTFGHSGWLWRGAFLLYDRETGSIWHHQTGVAMSGPLRGKALARIPTTALMTFDAWRAEHPATLVLAKPLDPSLDVDRDAYADRNRTLAFGVAVDLPGTSRLYPLAALPDAGVVEDDVTGVPLVVARHAASRAALAYDRRVDGATLHFEIEHPESPRPLLRERDGARRWYLLSGQPAGGAAPETPLRPLPATSWETNTWMLQHPRGTVWSRR